MSGQRGDQALERQLKAYRAMYQIGLEQRDCIARSDIEGLNQTFDPMRRLMDQIRLEQEDGPNNLADGDGQRALREIIGRIQGLHDDNEKAVRRLMGQTRTQLKAFQQGRRRVQSYGPQALAEARFVDSQQ